jgi:isocitrate/isopropylmalate dehydrogenase
MAMLLACGAVLHYAGTRARGRDGRRARSTSPSSRRRAAGVRTPDLGGHASTSEFTSEVVSRVRTKIDVWSSLGAAR